MTVRDISQRRIFTYLEMHAQYGYSAHWPTKLLELYFNLCGIGVSARRADVALCRTLFRFENLVCR